MKPEVLLLELLFPPKCVLCGCILKDGQQDLCRFCRMDAPEYRKSKTKPQFLDSLAAVWYYEENIRRSLLYYKFYGRRSYAKSYGRLLAMRLLREHPEGFDVLTWVPVSPLRKLRRGYDQAELIARAVSRELDLPMTQLLKKVRHTPAQSGISGAAQRRANILGAYRAIRPESIRGKRILLLDDIFTTGATAGEAARVLRTAGATEVHCAVIAAARKEI